MFTAAIVIIVSLAVAALLLRPQLRNSEVWQATVTPLASIIGSGFLIVVPLLGSAVGGWSVAAIAAIVLLAYAVGSAVRYNILHVEESMDSGQGAAFCARLERNLERIAKFALVLAYIIAVTFYLELLGAFALRIFDVHDPIWQKSIASVLLVFIAGYGLWRDLNGLEFLERYAVEIKLVVIGGLLAALLSHDLSLIAAGDWHFPERSHEWSVETLRRLLGAFLIVQGFETSRYLRGAYSPAIRAATMRRAQWIAAAIYVAFVGLATTLIGALGSVEETVIVDLSAQLSFVLPPMLIVGALMSQFSAAVADTIASGGLVEEGSDGRVPRRYAYAASCLLALALLWSADIFVVIAWASRAFAGYYALQCVIATVHSAGAGGRVNLARAVFFGVLAAAMAATAILAIPADTSSR